MLTEAARALFQEVFHAPAAGVVFAPGRVNLIGEHTDYNDGFVLPMAIHRGLALAFAARDDDVLRVHSGNVRQTCNARLSEVRRDLRTDPNACGNAGGWFSYVAGVAWTMREAGLPIRGADIALTGDLPMGAGLSSSAALEVGTARALAAASTIEWDPKTAALLAQRAEREFAGVECGIMDQLAVASAREDCALLIDCRSLDTRDVPLPDAMAVVVIDSGIRRQLASSSYNERRASCDRAVRAIRARYPGVVALRDVDPSMLEAAKPALSASDYRRARHVIAENRRPEAMSAALVRGDLAAAGRAMIDSHASLRDLYEVSTPELDTLAEAAAAQPGCHGARLTGAGFGGCVVAIADNDATESLVASVREQYRIRCGREARALVCRASAGARLIVEPHSP